MQSFNFCYHSSHIGGRYISAWKRNVSIESLWHWTSIYLAESSCHCFFGIFGHFSLPSWDLQRCCILAARLKICLIIPVLGHVCHTYYPNYQTSSEMVEKICYILGCLLLSLVLKVFCWQREEQLLLPSHFFLHPLGYKWIRQFAPVLKVTAQFIFLKAYVVVFD